MYKALQKGDELFPWCCTDIIDDVFGSDAKNLSRNQIYSLVWDMMGTYDDPEVLKEEITEEVDTYYSAQNQ